jgi:hypothetical protein
MRNKQFFSASEYNKQLQIEIERINIQPFQRKSGTRRGIYEEFEKHLLLPLPEIPYEPFVTAQAKVINTFHISYKRNYYSVPSNAVKIGQTLVLRIYAYHIDVYDALNSQCLCKHRLFPKNVIGQYDTYKDHMPTSPTGEWSRERFLTWAQKTGTNVYELVQKVFDQGRPEQIYYAKVHAILKMTGTYGADKLDHACRRCIDMGVNPTTKNIKALIETDVQSEVQNKKSSCPETAYLRGDDYYDGQK